MGMVGITRFVQVDVICTKTGTDGTVGRVEEGGTEKGRHGRAFEDLLHPRGFGCSAGNLGACLSERMTDSGRAGAAEARKREEYREIKSWN